MATHKDLIVWKKSIFLVKRIYEETRNFPKEEVMGITSQMRRSSLSISSNIAEGFGRDSDKELLHFLYIALGSASELDTQIIICKELNLFVNLNVYLELYNLNNEIIRMLTALINSRKCGLRNYDKDKITCQLVNLSTRQLLK